MWNLNDSTGSREEAGGRPSIGLLGLLFLAQPIWREERHNLEGGLALFSSLPESNQRHHSCYPREWPCPGSGRCISIDKVCDGVPDCPNGEDENNTTSGRQCGECGDPRRADFSFRFSEADGVSWYLQNELLQFSCFRDKRLFP